MCGRFELSIHNIKVNIMIHDGMNDYDDPGSSMPSTSDDDQ